MSESSAGVDSFVVRGLLAGSKSPHEYEPMYKKLMKALLDKEELLA